MNEEKAGGFDPGRHMIRLPKRVRDGNGWKNVDQDYLEVKWRLVWLRSEHPDAVIETEMVHHGPDLAVFKARVSIPNGGSSTGWGSETAGDFGDFIEKSETKAVGRALAALGYGTQFSEDFDFDAGSRTDTAKVVDAPVSRGPQASNGPMPVAAATPRSDRPTNAGGDGSQAVPMATEPQVKAIYAIGHGTLNLDEAEVDARCRERYGAAPQGLTRRQASEFIDVLKLSTSTAQR